MRSSVAGGAATRELHIRHGEAADAGAGGGIQEVNAVGAEDQGQLADRVVRRDLGAAGGAARQGAAVAVPEGSRNQFDRRYRLAPGILVRGDTAEGRAEREKEACFFMAFR